MTVAPLRLSPEAQRIVRNGADPAGYYKQHASEPRPAIATQNALDSVAIAADQRAGTKGLTWKDRIYDAHELSARTFDPVKWMLPGIIPEGVTILAGKPKIGKSWFALDICIAAADGSRYTLGDLKPRHGDCLYLALEDNQRRMKKRIHKLVPPDWVWPDRLDIAHEWKRSDAGGIDDLRSWCIERKAEGGSPTLIQIDTLQRFRPVVKGTDSYATDYAAVSALLALTKEFPGLCIIVVHHDRKMDADDPFDTVSGTLGITAAADTIMIIKRNAGAVKLYVRGRDVEDSEIPLRFEKTSCKWVRLNAEDAEASLSVERQSIVDAVESVPDGMGIPEIMSATGRTDRNATDQLLWKMVQDGEIKRIRRGVYGTSKIGKNGKKDSESTQCIENTQETDAIASLTDLTDLTDLTGTEPDDPADWSEARLNAEMPPPDDGLEVSGFLDRGSAQ